MQKLLSATLFLFLTSTLFAQDQEEKFVKVFGKVLNEKDSTGLDASILYEKLPYYDDMGMGKSGTDGGFEFYLIQGLKYNFSATKADFEPSKLEIEVLDADGDGSFSFVMYMKITDEKELITLKNLIFTRGSDQISESSFSELDDLVIWLDSRPNMIIQLEGHTDFAGNPEANMRLSQARVDAVKEYLLKKGVKKTRVLTKAFGGTQPIYTERTDEAKEKNRRVEVRVISK
jgi:OmpA-OmpF porin, OOP family